MAKRYASEFKEERGPDVEIQDGPDVENQGDGQE